MLELQFRAKQLSQICNAIFHVTLFAIFSQIRHRVAGPLVLSVCILNDITMEWGAEQLLLSPSTHHTKSTTSHYEETVTFFTGLSSTGK